VVAEVVVDHVQDLQLRALRIAAILLDAPPVRFGEAVTHLGVQNRRAAELGGPQHREPLVQDVARMVQIRQLHRHAGLLQNRPIPQSNRERRVLIAANSIDVQALLLGDRFRASAVLVVDAELVHAHLLHEVTQNVRLHRLRASPPVLRADVRWHHVRRLILRVPVALPADPTSARLRDDDRGEVVSVFEDERALS
jgi:hypothetical protein